MSESSVESQVAGFLAKYSPPIATRLREARRRLRAFFPNGFELVFDNYNALVFGISPTEKASQAFVSVAGYPRWVTLFFLHGASLNDPHGLLEGQGKQVRGIRLETAATINTPAVESLIAQAALTHQPALIAAPALSTCIKSVLTKQRPRRPTLAVARTNKPSRVKRAAAPK